jgi:hypothetical protein
MRLVGSAHQQEQHPHRIQQLKPEHWQMKFRMIASTMMLATATVGLVREANAAPPADKAKAALQRYFKAWNETDVEERQALLESAWTKDGTYTDPGAHVEGRDALVAHIGGFLSDPQFKGFSIVQASEIDVHHQVFRFEWEMKDPGGKTVIVGMDYGEFNDDGAITKIVGFFGPFPELK